MPNILGTKLGNPTLGTPGGIVTWSYSETLPGGDPGGVIVVVTDPTQDPVPPAFPEIDREPAIQSALREWSTFGDVEFLQVSGPDVAPGQSDKADLRIHFDGLSSDPLSVSFTPDASGGGDIVIRAEPTLRLGRGEYYDFDPDLFQGLLLRELGRALGLGTVDDNSVMTDTVNFSELQDDDKLGISQIYGAQGAEPAIYKVKGKALYEFAHAPDNVIVQGDNKANRILGHDSGTIYGMGGNDVLKSYGDDDAMFGGDGRDKLFSYNGNDTLFGGNGRDKLVSTSGDDQLFGDGGDDTLIGHGNGSYLDGGDGYDLADYRDDEAHAGIRATMVDLDQPTGGINGDILINIEKVIGSDRGSEIGGNAADNKIIGGASDDTLAGNGGNDTIKGKDGADALAGGEGNDKLNGGSGSDTLEGGGGDDILQGRSQGDVFVFADDHGHDKIRDFSTRNDLEYIDLSNVTGFDSFDDVRDAARNTFQGVVIETGDDSSIRLDGVRLGQLDADDFLFT